MERPAQLRLLDAQLHVVGNDVNGWPIDSSPSSRTLPVHRGTAVSMHPMKQANEAISVWSVTIDITVVPYFVERFQCQSSLNPYHGLTATFEIENRRTSDFLCLYQHKEWWMRPTWCSQTSAIPPQTQLMLWKSEDVGEERWNVFLPICSDSLRGDCSASENNQAFTLSASSNESGQIAMKGVVALFATGNDPYSCIKAGVDCAARICNIDTVEKREFPRPLEGLGWCTWDSLGRDVNEDSIIAKLNEFKSCDVPISWVLIDDGWSNTNRAKDTLHALDADSSRFPHGLAHTIQRIKSEYDVPYVGVWQAFQGYWNGIETQGPAASIGKGFLTMLPNGCLVPQATAEGAFGWWNAWDGYLRQCGVDFVKVDSQSSMSLMTRGIESYGVGARTRHSGLDAAVAINFGGSLINCMGMAPEDYWHRPVSPVTRTSDDYLPHDPDSLDEHILQNAYNSLLMGDLYHCDWDMFWSEHVHARTSALLRLISAGPLYCSDALGRSDAKILAACVSSGGENPRCDAAPLLAADNLVKNPQTNGGAICLQNSVAGVPVFLIVGLLKLEQQEHNSRRHATIHADSDQWLYSWEQKTAQALNGGQSVEISIEAAEAKIFYSVTQKQLNRQHGIHVLGLTSKYLSPAFVRSVQSCSDCIDIELTDPGDVAILDPDCKILSAHNDYEELTWERKSAVIIIHSDRTALSVTLGQ